ncbi:hypothetical protein JAAARDRAFT_163503 [Jaapia argillacea MUCL 33604]|uniref:Phosphoglycerate mutase n=1 Tax=Jaapia argillacea MUCL 33604 TaxID=933084 RepID=A0A067PKL6_9AGAM|nr:hypothetical protein JAAARDRAFT_163503 [Jaapia argillacea MUCL 33604]
MKIKAFEHIPGYFVQDSPDADPSAVGPLPPRFGLLDSSPSRWSTLKSKIDKLNRSPTTRAEGASYKIFFLGRHGEGWHNVAEAKYGTKAWDEYWSKLDGDGEIVWGPDPDLTRLGRDQALDAHKAWRRELEEADIPAPEKLYSSPLTRAMHTNVITFDGAFDQTNLSKTMVLENCREEYGEHTCDLRRSRSYISSAFPQFTIEEGFSEIDELWKADERETKEHAEFRARIVCERVWDDGEEVFISITAHGGFINAFLRATGHPPFQPATGAVVPLVVKGRRGGILMN